MNDLPIRLGNTAQCSGGICGEFRAIYRPQESRFTAGKPSIFAVVSCTKFIRICTASFVRYCLCTLLSEKKAGAFFVPAHKLMMGGLPPEFESEARV